VPAPAPGRLRIYVVDDSVAYGTLVAAWLSVDAELEVVAAVRTAAEALDGLAAAAPDVVMLDHLLPDPETSRRVLEHVRSVLPAAAVLLISGMPGDDLATEASATGADHHVTKAADAGTLSAAIRTAVARRRAQTSA
jgi:DNA-binding NarL/FixJ family response regulator